MPKIDLDAIPQTNATGYPSPFNEAVRERWYRRLPPASGLSEFGASHVVLKPGAWSSQRHWHEGEDEMIVMLSGEAVLVEDGGTAQLGPGDICIWPKGTGDGHHLRNDSAADCVFLAVSAGTRLGGGYSDIDMLFTPDSRYTTREGEDYGVNRV